LSASGRRETRAERKHTTLEHSQAALAVETGDVPVTANPDVTKLVGTAELVSILDGDELTNEGLPEVEAVLGGVELRVLDGDTAHIVGDPEDVTLVEAGVHLGGRVEGVGTNDERGDLVAGRHDNDIGRGADLGEIRVESVAPASWSASVSVGLTRQILACTQRPGRSR
jgi:hypothetical protein